MDSNRCPTPEDWAVFSAGGASEAEWRRHVRHLADCSTCRRHASLLALSEGATLPPARLGAPPPPIFARTRVPAWRVLARAAAAALVLGALGWSLHVMNRNETPSVALRDPAPVPAPAPKTVKALPELPPALKPKAPPPESPGPRRDFVPPLRGLVREDPTVPDPSPAPPPAAEPPRTPAPTPFIAQHTTHGVAEAIEISPSTGSLTVDYDATSEALARATYVRPSQALRTREGGSFSLPDGATVHLAKEGEISVSWSQTLLCYSIDLHRGEALVDLGAAPRILHVSNGALGVRLADSSGQIHLAAGAESLRATPL